jgi:hypothetical protein
MLHKGTVMTRFDPVDVAPGVELAKWQSGQLFGWCSCEDQRAPVKRQFDDRILHTAIMAIAVAVG